MKTKTLIFWIFSICLKFQPLYSQLKVGNTTHQIDQSAILEIESQTQGFYPRV